MINGCSHPSFVPKYAFALDPQEAYLCAGCNKTIADINRINGAKEKTLKEKVEYLLAEMVSLSNKIKSSKD